MKRKRNYKSLGLFFLLAGLLLIVGSSGTITGAAVVDPDSGSFTRDIYSIFSIGGSLFGFILVITAFTFIFTYYRNFRDIIKIGKTQYDNYAIDRMCLHNIHTKRVEETLKTGKKYAVSPIDDYFLSKNIAHAHILAKESDDKQNKDYCLILTDFDNIVRDLYVMDLNNLNNFLGKHTNYAK